MVWLTAAPAHAAEVTVTLKDGRKFTAEVDARTNAERLWLRFGTSKTTILRPIEWPAIAEVRRDDAVVAVEELKRQATAAPPQVADAATAPAAKPRGGLQLWRVPGAESVPTNEMFPPVRSLQIEAYAANWDADVENDGLVLTWTALDDYGQPTLGLGTLEVELIGERLPPYSRGNAFPVLGRWALAVTADTISAGGYHRARLPFQAVHPDYETAWPTFALAHVRLTVPGQGVFEASADAVALRSFSPVRDRIESASGTRFLPTEQTGRSKRLSSRGPVD